MLYVESSGRSDVTHFIWSKIVSLKVTIFAWWLLRNRIPTAYNLFIRGIIQDNVQMCVGGCGSNENVHHLFLCCDFIGRIQFLVLQWSGIVLMNTLCLYDHLIQFSHLDHFSKHVPSPLHLIWLSHVWVIWKEINSCIFRHKEESLQYLANKVKLLSY